MKEPVGQKRRKRMTKRQREDMTYRVSKVWDTRWTPNNEELQELLNVAVREASNPHLLAQALGMRYRHLRRILHGDTKAVSYRVVDRILYRSSVSYRINDLPWLTVVQLVEQGIWKPQRIFRKKDAPWLKRK